MEPYQLTLEEKLRNEALKRITDYNHPSISLRHQPIKARQCQELQQQLRKLVHQKVETARREYHAKNYDKDYDSVYGQFVRMTAVNEAQQEAVCNSIKEMHQMADMLTHPPRFGGDLYLSSSAGLNSLQLEEYKDLYNYYQRLYKSGHQVDQNQAQQTIKHAKQYYLRDRS